MILVAILESILVNFETQKKMLQDFSVQEYIRGIYK